jgi:hypothetical protein
MSSSKRDRHTQTKWTKVNGETIDHLAQATSARGSIFSLAVTAIPRALQKMPGAVSCFFSAYSAPIASGLSVTVTGELAVVRADRDLLKAYIYFVAASNDSEVCFTGPYKDFKQHHIASSTPVDITDFFGQASFKK